MRHIKVDRKTLISTKKNNLGSYILFINYLNLLQGIQYNKHKVSLYDCLFNIALENKKNFFFIYYYIINNNSKL